MIGIKSRLRSPERLQIAAKSS